MIPSMTLPCVGMFVISSPLRWKYYSEAGLEVSYFTPGAFGHWSVAMLIKDPAVLLDLLYRIEKEEEDAVSRRGLEVSIDDDGHICIVMGQRGVAIDPMDLDRLRDWLKEARKGVSDGEVVN